MGRRHLQAQRYDIFVQKIEVDEPPSVLNKRDREWPSVLGPQLPPIITHKTAPEIKVLGG